jgi:hypothetical protein
VKVPRQLIAFGVSREAMGLLADTCGSQFETVVPRGSEFRCCIMNDRREDLHPLQPAECDKILTRKIAIVGNGIRDGPEGTQLVGIKAGDCPVRSTQLEGG